MNDPLPRWQLVLTAVGVGGLAGCVTFVALTVIILLRVRITHWLEDR